MLLQTQPDTYYIGTILLTVLVVLVIILILLFIRKIVTTITDGIEMIYAYFTKKPIFVHFYPILRKLNSHQEHILKNQFTFYNRLDNTHKKYFRHRVATFIKKKQFIGKEGFIITDEVEILISATAVMLTFGFRDYIIKSIKTIIVYPTKYYSTVNENYHKGEYNFNLKTLVLSWDNFLEGFKIEDDKLNLGIHEFAHAIHFNSIYQEDINSIIFVDTYNELREILESNEALKNKLITSEFLRSYAFTNDIELLAVILETFIETPKAFEVKFPVVYSKVKQMLNFNFKGY